MQTWCLAFPAGMRSSSRPCGAPLVLTAAAILAMIPLSRSVFWGPMAITMMGGLLIATILTLLFLPALYAAWFRVRQATAEATNPLPQVQETLGSRLLVGPA
jgi:multidrug efflux pump